MQPTECTLHLRDDRADPRVSLVDPGAQSRGLLLARCEPAVRHLERAVERVELLQEVAVAVQAPELDGQALHLRRAGVEPLAEDRKVALAAPERPGGGPDCRAHGEDAIGEESNPAAELVDA